MKHFLHVYSNAVQGREDDFERWYRDVHVREMLQLPGFIACQRYVLSESQMGRSHPQRHLAIWEIETDNLAALHDQLLGDMASGALTGSDAFDLSTAVNHTFSPIGERTSSEDGVHLARPSSNRAVP